VLDELTIESDALRDNPLGDPHVRPLWVYTPPEYDGGPAVYMPSSSSRRNAAGLHSGS
jgi:hypothetical protein